MRPAVLAWAAAVLGASKASGDSNTCSKDDWRQSNNRLGSKGSFGPLNTSETLLGPLLAALSEEDYDAKRCPPVYAVAVARHGSRYPSESKRSALLALWEARCGSSAAGSSAATTRLAEWCRAAAAVRTVAAAALAPRGVAEMEAWATRLLDPGRE